MKNMLGIQPFIVSTSKYWLNYRCSSRFTTLVPNVSTSSNVSKNDKGVKNIKASTDKIKAWNTLSRKKLCNALTNYRNKSKSEIKKSLDGIPLLEVDWSDQERNLILGALGYCDQLSQAYDLLESTPNGSVEFLHQIIYDNAKAGKAEYVLDALNVAKRLNILPTRNTYLWIISACARSYREHAEKAFEIHQDMMHQGFDPTLKSYSMLIVACAKLNDWSGAVDNLERMKQLTPQKLEEAYSAAITALGYSKKSVFALKLFDLMRSEMVEPDLKTYNALITACARIADFQTALNLFEELKESSHDLDIYSYNALLSAYGTTWQSKKAYALLQEMRDARIEPDIFSYNSALQACNFGADSETAIILLQEMINNGIEPDLITLNTSISALGRNGSMNVAETFFKKYSSDNDTLLRRDRVTFESLMEGYVCSNRWQDAIDLWNTSYTCRRRAKSAKTLNFLLRACAALGDYKQAITFINEFEVRRLRPQLVSYNHVLRSFLNAKKYEEAKDYWKSMKSNDIASNIHTYSIMMHGALKAQANEDCIDIFHEYQTASENGECKVENGFDSALIMMVVDAMMNLEQWENVLDLLDQVISHDIPDDAIRYLYKQAIHCCDHLDRWRLAVDLYDAIIKLGDHTGNNEAYQATISVVARAGEIESALERHGGDWYRNHREEV